MRRFGFLLALAALLSACRATLRPDFVPVIAKLGKPVSIDGGSCAKPELSAAFQEEIASSKEPLSARLLPFATRAAAICPQSHPFIRTESDLDAKEIAALIGAAEVPADGRLQLEPWLFVRTAGNKAVGLELALDRL